MNHVQIQSAGEGAEDVAKKKPHWCRGPESNWLRPPFQGGALPVSYPGTRESVNFRGARKLCQMARMHVDFWCQHGGDAANASHTTVSSNPNVPADHIDHWAFDPHDRGIFVHLEGARR